MLSILAASDPLEHVLPHPLFNLGPIVVTNQMFMAAVAAGLMLILFPILFRKSVAAAPTGAKNFFESILEFLRVEVFRPALKEHTDRFVPFLWTLFFFILFCNLLGSIPLGEIVMILTAGKGGVWNHVGGTATGNIATTAALAICAFLFIHLNGIFQIARDLIRGTYGHHAHHDEHTSSGAPGHEAAHDLNHMRGEALAADVPQQMDALTHPTTHYPDDEHPHPASAAAVHAAHGTNPLLAILLAPPLYFWNFAPHPFKPQPGQSPIAWVADIPVWGLLLVLELVGAIIKPFALCMRLFANMIAGHIVLAVLVSLIPVTAGLLLQIGIGTPITAMSLLVRVLELFVAFLQAYIFTFLTTLFIASAVAPEH